MRTIIQTAAATLLASAAFAAPDVPGNSAPNQPAPDGEQGGNDGKDAGTETGKEATGDASQTTAQQTSAEEAGKQTGDGATQQRQKTKSGGGKSKNATPPPAPARRESKIAPIQEKVVGLLKKSSMTVQAMATKLECSERNIRQAIDRARAQGEKINRVQRNTFGYEKPKRA